VVMLLAEGAKVPLIYEWSHARRVLAPMVEDTGGFPARFRVRDYPTRKQIAALGEPMDLQG
jgi:hypothetical protein